MLKLTLLIVALSAVTTNALPATSVGSNYLAPLYTPPSNIDQSTTDEFG